VNKNDYYNNQKLFDETESVKYSISGKLFCSTIKSLQSDSDSAYDISHWRRRRRL